MHDSLLYFLFVSKLRSQTAAENLDKKIAEK